MASRYSNAQPSKLGCSITCFESYIPITTRVNRTCQAYVAPCCQGVRSKTCDCDLPLTRALCHQTSCWKEDKDVRDNIDMGLLCRCHEWRDLRDNTDFHKWTLFLQRWTSNVGIIKLMCVETRSDCPEHLSMDCWILNTHHMHHACGVLYDVSVYWCS